MQQTHELQSNQQEREIMDNRAINNNNNNNPANSNNTNNQTNAGSSNSSSVSSSTANTTQPTGIVTSDSVSSASTSSTSPDQLISQQQQPQLPQIGALNDDVHNSNNFLIEQLAHLNQNKQQRLLLNQFQNTLSKHQVLEHLQHQQQQQQAMDSQNKYLTNARGTSNNAQMCQYVDLNSQMPMNPHLSHLNQSAQAHTAYLVQTPNGSALLIPPHATLSHNNHFLTTTNNCQTTTNPNQTNLNTFARGQAGAANTNNLHYGLGTMSFNAQQPNILSANMNNMGNSIASPCFARSESTASTNVYQTIDAEKNGYMYPIENIYEGAYNNHTNSTNLNTHNSSKRKSKKSIQRQHSQFSHFNQPSQQMTSQCVKLLDNHNNLSNLTGSTLHSNTNNTNSNFFASPATTSTSASPSGTSTSKNRRHMGDTSLDRFKSRLTNKLRSYCTWKCLAAVFLFIIINLFTFIVYLSVMRSYNLNWHLKQSPTGQRVKTSDSNSMPSPILFSRIGDTIDDQIEPNELFNIQFYLDKSMYIKFNLTFSKNSQIGIYADKNASPTFTKFRIFERFNGQGIKSDLASVNDRLDKRNSQETFEKMVNTGFVVFLEQGLWYFSILNDNKTPLKFQLKTEFHEYSTNSKACPSNCNGKGECKNGQCKCFPGFSGLDCSTTNCPILCNGHGKYENGKCSCDLLWHGDECELPINECKVADCNRNGACVNGKCQCHAGFKGETCEEATCSSPNCSNNGVCLDAKCVCFNNYTGVDCSQRVETIGTLCSNRGNFNLQTKACECQQGWMGIDCSIGENCLNKECTKCKNGWSGMFCMVKSALTCDSRCSLHGFCVNGTCTCSQGYQGRNCDINSCPNSCNLNGLCEKTGLNRFQCVCNPGWTGRACDVAIEMTCNDDIDNDRDGLTDCMDSDCCGFDTCKLSLACSMSPEPKDRLLRKQPPSITATFFEKMRFLIEDNSVQSFANSNSFIESQVSVIRGQVLYKNGQPLIGVKVGSVSNPAYGYTLTRQNGIFDLMVNGGGSIQLEFSKNRLRTHTITVNAVWNQFVYIDPVVMYLQDDQEVQEEVQPCHSVQHDTNTLYPIVNTNWKVMRTHYDEKQLIIPDSGIVRSELKLLGSQLKLVYTSNHAAGYQSTIYTLLTQQQIPEQLQLVHLKIVIEGVLHKQTFDAIENLRYEYAWDRRNAYEQRVYGFTYAKVMVGYQYENCAFVYWHSSVVKLAGYDLASSEIGNWNLDVHHRLNVQQGILHKGDGTTIYLKEIQKTVEVVAGQLKVKRDLDCLDCDLMAASSESVKFYSPYSLSINRDGLIFVADYNFVWMLNGTEPAKRVLQMNLDQPYKYFLSNEPATGNLYFTDSTRRSLFSLRNMEQIYDLKANFKLAEEICASNGDCSTDLPSSSKSALVYPKSLVFDSNGLLYFIDANQIKSISKQGSIRTLVGNDENADAMYKPVGCEQSLSLDSFRFYWPRSLAVNPLDNSLYILDENVIYKLTQASTRAPSRIEVVAGVPYSCSFQAQADRLSKKLHNAVDMAFNPDGELYILENDKHFKQIRVLKSDGDLELFFNDESSKNHLFDFDSSNGDFAGFDDPIAIAVHQNRSVYVLDRGNNVLYHIRNSISRDEYTGKYTIVSADERQAYIFNRFGLHLHTADLITGNMLYNFTYNGNALYGKLISVSDQFKPIVNIKRDFNGRVEQIQTNNAYTIRVKLNNFGSLKSLSQNENKNYTFEYVGNSGLLATLNDVQTQKQVTFVYDKSGHVQQINEDANVQTKLEYFINSSGIVSVLSQNDPLNVETWITNKTGSFVYQNSKFYKFIETNRSNLNIGTISNEDLFNSFRAYFKQSLSNTDSLKSSLGSSSANQHHRHNRQGFRRKQVHSQPLISSF